MSPRLLVSALLTFGPATLLAAPTLVGFASLPADTLIPGPTSGQFIDPASPNGRATPFTDQQPVQGFSSVIAGQGGRFLALSDNGFGSQDNSADALLQIHELEIDFRTQGGGSGGVTLVQSRALSDPNDQVDFTIVAEMTNYPNSSIAVDSAIASARLLTGADFDQESFRRDANGNYWIGDEFGPFLYKTNAQFELLRAPVRTPGVQAPQNPFLGSGTPNLPTSRGYEGMAISQDGMTLFPMLEGTVTGDPDGTLRIYEFDVALEAFTDKQWLYPLSDPGHAIGELTQINDEQFLVIERDWNEGDAAAFKKVFRIDLTDLDPSSGQLRKTEILDLLAIADPYDLNMDGLLTFDFPFVTIESILPIDAYTVLIAYDNNYPFSRGRTDIDDNEIILVRLDQPLAVPVAPTALLLGLGLALMLGLGRPLLWRRRRG
jgi:hypothetical protein